MGRPFYTKEMEEFIFGNYEKHNTSELTRMFNEKFGTEKTKDQIRAFRRRHGLDSSHLQGSGGNIYPKEVKEFIRANYKGTGYQQMVRLIYQNFGLVYSPTQIRSYYKNNKLNSGLKGNLFQKGVANYRQKKGQWSPGCEKTWFKKGHVPHNYVPVGTEKVRPSNGYVWVKIAEPKKWRMKHLLVWEAAHGPVPNGWKIYFKDGNPQNCELDNLMLIEQRVLGSLNANGLSVYKGELAEAAVNVAKLSIATNDAKKRKKEEMC